MQHTFGYACVSAANQNLSTPVDDFPLGRQQEYQHTGKKRRGHPAHRTAAAPALLAGATGTGQHPANVRGGARPR